MQSVARTRSLNKYETKSEKGKMLAVFSAPNQPSNAITGKVYARIMHTEEIL
jgi:hypothetical protein